MKELNKITSLIFTKSFYYKAISYGILLLILFSFSDFIIIFFLTFIFAYLFYSIAKFLKEKVEDIICKKLKSNSSKTIFKKYFSLNLIIVIEYFLFLLIFISIISGAVPKIQSELTGLANTIPILQDQLNNIKAFLWNINKDYTEIGSTLKEAFSSSDYKLFIEIFNRAKSAWIVLLQIVFSLILSLVFLLDRKRLKSYLSWIKKSNFSFLYNEYKIIFDKIIRSFGLIIKAQSLIALINTVLTSIGLFIIWSVFMQWIWFPYLLTLWLVVFIFWFVPVLWVFLSSIPILIVAYSSTGSIAMVIAIILLIIIIHTIEAYYLNPKIFSNFLKLPLSLTFLILFIWERLFWIAGLLIWVSLFYFIAELLKDFDGAISKLKTKKAIASKK